MSDEPREKLTPRTLNSRRVKLEKRIIDAQIILRSQTPIGDSADLLPAAARAKLISALVDALALATEGWTP